MSIAELLYAPWGPYFLLAPWLCRQSISYGEERRDCEGKLTGYRSRPACFRSGEVA